MLGWRNGDLKIVAHTSAWTSRYHHIDVLETAVMSQVTSTESQFQLKYHQKLCLFGIPCHYFAANTLEFCIATLKNGGPTWSATSLSAAMTFLPMWHCSKKLRWCVLDVASMLHASLPPKITWRRAYYGDVCMFFRMSAFVFAAF